MKTKLLFSILVLLNFTFLNAQCKKHLSDSLIARWDFNGDAYDSSGNGNNGIIHSAKLTSSRCNDSTAYFFNRKRLSQYIQVHNSKLLNLANTDYSICAWINATAAASVIIAKRTGTHLQSGYILGVGDDLKLMFNIGGGSSDAIQMISSGNVADTTWRFVAVTYQKSNKRFSMYINGVLDTVYRKIPSPTKTGSKLRIGNDTYYTSTSSRNYEFDGKIDDIRMYNRLLDTCEITALYNKSCNVLNHLSNLNSVQRTIANHVSSINVPKGSIDIFPNPAKNSIRITLPNNASNNAYILLCDFSGRKVLEQKCSANNSYQQLNVSDIASGTYRISIVENGKVINGGTVVIAK